MAAIQNRTDAALDNNQPDTAGCNEVLQLYHRCAQHQRGQFVLSYGNPKRYKEEHNPSFNCCKFSIGAISAMATEAVNRGSHQNVYFGTALMRNGLEAKQRGKKADIEAVLALVIDDDADTGRTANLPTNIDPTFTVETSRFPSSNRQHHFVFDEPQSGCDADTLAELLHRKCGGDSCTKDTAHAWRLPGTLNFPPYNKIERGRPETPQQVRLIGGSRKALRAEHLRDALEAMPDLRPKAGTVTPIEWKQGGETDRAKLLAKLPAHLHTKIAMGNNGEDEDRSKHCHATLLSLCEHGLTDDEILTVSGGAPFAQKFWEGRSDLPREIRKARSKWVADGKYLVAEGAASAERLTIGGNVVALPSAKVATDTWCDPKPIETKNSPVPALTDATSAALLPKSLRDWVMDGANRKPCPPEYVAAKAIVDIGTVIGARCGIKPKKLDDWTVLANLYGAGVGEPSWLKSPGFAEAGKPLGRLITKEKERVCTEQKRVKDGGAILKARRKACLKKMDAAAKAELPDEEDENAKAEGHESLEKLGQHLSELETEGAEPTERRYLTNDGSIEKVAELLQSNPAGVQVFRDELTGWLASLEKQGHEPDRAFYLEAWNGTGSFQVDRIGRGSNYVPNLCVSLFGGIQPDKLQAYLELTSEALANDGLIQRFQMLVYPDPAKWDYVDRTPDKAARDRVFAIFEKLADFDPVAWGAAPADEFNKFPAFSFDDEAQNVFKAWTTELHLKIREEEQENKLIAQHLGKYDKLFCALALIFHLVEYADKAGEGPVIAGPVTVDAAIRAAAWCAFLEAHARRCYGLLADEGMRSARELAEKISKGKLRDGFTAYEVKRNCWRHLTSQEAIDAAIAWLDGDEYGWLRGERVGGTGPGAGQPTTRYRINPKLLAGVGK